MSNLATFPRCLLNALIDAPVAWQTPEGLARLLGADFESTCDALADLDASGWLDPWELDGTLHVTLSSRAAANLRVRLVPVGRTDAYRWASIDDPEPPEIVGGRRHGGMTVLELLADPTPGPEALAEVSETIPAGPEASVTAGLPRPKILLGLGLTPWPGPGRDPALPCLGCGSAPMAEIAYCLVCDRWGLDHRLKARRAGAVAKAGGATSTPRANRTNPDPSHAPSKPASPEQARAMDARERRKAKRRRKLDQKAGTERAGRGQPDSGSSKPAIRSADR